MRNTTGRYDPDNPQRPGSGLRLLPWASLAGNPCFLRSDDAGGGFLARKADLMEAEQMREGAAVLLDAEEVLEDPAAGPLTLRVTLLRTAMALGDVLRIADSRGGRLPVPEPDRHEQHDHHDRRGEHDHHD
ncbi:hypothetical protein OIU91_20865 [Streptomyces sp. NBC_01456]|uniref:hypothetical protein n=1 Tax=unclassified Streptomyces TaxID=2593676 RepID=UPI002E32F8A4|nr:MULTISPECIES: hypothetical protein [unclassified Streptomyces]